MKMIAMMLTLFISFSSFAGKEMKDEKAKGEFLKKELNLSDEQLAKVLELKKNAHSEIQSTKEQYQKLRKEFKEAMKDSKASNLDLTTKYEAVAKAREDFQAKRFQMLLKMREVLTPAQMEKFQEIRKKFKDKFYGKGKKKK